MNEEIFSTRPQLEKLAKILAVYASCPFGGETIPGAILETMLAHIREGRRLGTYDFIDVLKQDTKCGWQVKSTKDSTPVTWKRAKIPNQEKLIIESQKSGGGAQALGNAIIAFCNEHVHASFRDYGLERIGYARLILHSDGRVSYFERLLCTKESPILFQTKDFSWKWSIAKKTEKKEQLQALHGIHIPTNEKWWAWHGLGENQLHFSGERNWWPESLKKNVEISPPKPVGAAPIKAEPVQGAVKGGENSHIITFRLPDKRMELDAFVTLLEEAAKRT